MSRIEGCCWVLGRVVLSLSVCLLMKVEQVVASPRELSTTGADSLELRELSFRDVIRQQGPALEKIEYESSRRVRWRYADYDVLFVNGRAQLGPGGVLQGASWTGVVPSSSPPRAVGLEVVSPEAERIFNEILKEIPSGPDEPSDAGFPLPGGGAPSRVPGLVRPAPGIELSPQME